MTPVPPPSLADWPGRDRREPSRSDRHYLMLSPLARALRDEIGRALGHRAGLRVLDIGCGVKPYYPLLADRAGEYRGLDRRPGPQVDDVGDAGALPYADGSVDVVLCTQVLEHIGDPAGAVGEIARVLAPGGVALVSTHGVFVYHPDPVDYWRWTVAGLAELFRSSGDWAEIRVLPNGEAVACLGYLACQYLDELGRRAGSEALRRGLLRAVNTVAERLDARLPPRARGAEPGSLSANFLVSARRA
jgi:SAM-dependent methyltransferase